jgi:hypothetical protein
MTEGGAVEAATITAVYEAVLEHHQDHRHDIPSTHASALDCPTILHALQAAQEEAEAKVARLREALARLDAYLDFDAPWPTRPSEAVLFGDTTGINAAMAEARQVLNDEGHQAPQDPAEIVESTQR